MRIAYNLFLFQVLFLWSLTIGISTVTAQSCTSPSGESGLCVPYRKCGFIKLLLEKYNSTVPQHIQDYVLKSRCNNNKRIHICCESIPPNPPGSDVSNAIFSGADYETALNPRGVAILARQNCGSINGNRISFAIDAHLGEITWMALLKYENSQEDFNCGGSVITERYVLTAAHCVQMKTGKLISVRLGEFDTSTNPDCIRRRNKNVCAPRVLDVGVEKTIAHPFFNLVTLLNDVGLVKMDRNVQFHRYLKPVCLPLNEISLEPRDDSRYYISGWGYTETGNVSRKLQRASIQYQNRQVCANAFEGVKFHVSHLCVGGDGKVDACKGDSGGPLFYLAPYRRTTISIEYRWIQFGVISFGDFYCGRVNGALPGVYANLIELMPWITNNID